MNPGFWLLLEVTLTEMVKTGIGEKDFFKEKKSGSGLSLKNFQHFKDS